jgi:UDP-N-acetylmuramoylalanine--D-glutamate ligase
MKIAIAGYGVEGKASYTYYTSLGHDVTILDERETLSYIPLNAATIVGSRAFDDLNDFDIVIRSPSIAPKRLKTAKKIWSATNEFFEKCPAQIIGVTGTKGKGTTSSLIALILKNAGRTVHLVGNIGIPALSVLDSIDENDIVVYELSSFQLWDLNKSPHIAVVLMIEPDHLNVHADFDDYVKAKSNITAHQSAKDVVIYHPTNEKSAQIASVSAAIAKKRYQTMEAAYVQDGEIKITEHTICSVYQVGLKGAYNLQNICAAVSASWFLTNDINAIAKAISNFKGLEHRIEFVANKQGIAFYDDSYSSAPTATMAAITAFHEPTILILGGYDRGINLRSLVKTITMTDTIKRVIILGQVKEKIAALFTELNYDKFTSSDASTMQAILSSAMSFAEKGDVILLSPGCASFDMFKDFSERGQLFKDAVKAIHE